MHGEDSADPKMGTHYNPARAQLLEKVPELAAQARLLAKQHRTMPNRPQAVAYRLLERHAEYCQGLSKIMTAKCKGYNKLALEMLQDFNDDFGKYDYELENQFDLNLAMYTLDNTVRQMPKLEVI